MKKRILALLLALTLLVPGGCTVRDTVQIVESSVTTLQELADAALSEETEAPESGEQFVTAEDPEVRPPTRSASTGIITTRSTSFCISTPMAICRTTT